MKHEFVSDTPVAMTGRDGKPVDLDKVDRILEGNRYLVKQEKKLAEQEKKAGR